MKWKLLAVADCGTHHVNEAGLPAYEERFDEVLKFHPPGLAPVLRGGQAWHIQSDGTAAYTHRFSRTFGFYDGLAAVVTPNGWCHISPDGNFAYGQRYDWCGNFQQGRCTVRDQTGAYFHITPQGGPVYPARWRYAGDYRDGIAVVQAADGQSTHVGLDGSILHDKWFVDLDVFHKGFARARDEFGWTHVDIHGEPLYQRRFAAVEPFYNGQARVERFDGGLEVIDEHGAILVELRTGRRSEFASLSEDLVGFWKTQTIGAAVEVGVVEALPATEREVAQRCGLEVDGALRLLRALGELGITARSNGQWSLTARGALLRSDHPLTLADAAVEYAGPFTALWRGLADAVRQNSAWTAPDIFGDLSRNDTRRTGHHRMLQSYARHDYAAIGGALSLRGDEHVLDAGGGLGVVAQSIVGAYPSVEVTVLERPEVVAMATPCARVHWHSRSLFEPWAIQADAVVLSRVLHDWDDSNALEILEHARATLPRGGRLYIVEMLLSEGQVAGALCDLHLLMATGGRERTLAHFERLLSAAGFEFAEVRRLPTLPSILVGVAI